MITIRAAEPNDLHAVREMLLDARLPVAGVEAALDQFLVAEAAGRVVGAVGLELYGEYGLLRSAVVRPERRGGGVGAALTRELHELARTRGCTALFLLTTTASDFFAHLGFHPVARAQVPPEVQASEEFRDLCPASAVVMRTDL